MSSVLRYLRPAELAHLGLGHGVVESSAGTGKTFLLEHLFVDFVLTRGVPAHEILVVTFTEKATAELVLRIRSLLARLQSLGPTDSDAIRAAAHPTADAWLIDEQARARLQKALLSFDRTNIFTIHGFCQRILREHPFAQGRLFDEELVAEKGAFTTAFHDVLRTSIASDAKLQVAMEEWLRTGETIDHLHDLLSQSNKSGITVFYPTFDEARLTQALARWQSVVSDAERWRPHVKAAGIHGNSVGPLLARLARVSSLLTASEGNSMRFLAAMQKFPHEPKMQNGLAHVLEKLGFVSADSPLAPLHHAVREMHESALPLAAVLTQMLLPLVRQRAHTHKRSAGLYDFADMLTLVERALSGPEPASSVLLQTLRGRYLHALIDEFQDTDCAQWSIFRRIFVEAHDAHTLTVIGDPKQAIYGFRGADVRTYLAASQELRAAQGTSIVLDRNFRSTAQMVEATNDFFDQRANFFRPAGAILYDHPVRCGRPDLALTDDRGTQVPPVVVFGLLSPQSPLSAARARQAVRAAIATELRSLLGADSALRLWSEKGAIPLRARDIFVLTFSNNESLEMGRTLDQAGIPFSYYKLGSLFSSPEATEVLDLLRAIAAPEDPSLRARALLTRFFGLGLLDVAVCLNAASDKGPAKILYEWNALARRGDMPGLFAAVQGSSGMVRREVFLGPSERSLTNVLHLFEILQAEWTCTRASLEELCSTLESYLRGTRMPPGQAGEGDLQRLETDRDAVQILTAHKAKGLEASVVFVYGGTGESQNNSTHVFHRQDQRVLHIGKLDQDDKASVRQERDDEDARLLYVALTRARYRLYLPQYPPELKSLSGRYRQANQRLSELVGKGHAFSIRSIPCSAAFLSPPDEPGNLAGRPAREIVSPPPDLLAEIALPASIADLAKERRGFAVTSYTSMKRAHGGKHRHADKHAPGVPIEASQEPRSLVGSPIIVPGASEELPGGADTGVFLHEILECVSLAELANSPAFPAWSALPTVTSLVEKLCRRHSRPAEHGASAIRLVHTAYTAPARLGEIVMPRLAFAHTALREMEFLFPIPEKVHPLLSRPLGPDGSRVWTIARGVVNGVIDFLFEYGDKVYLCDWKSDRLPDWGVRTLARHCDQNYDVQARIYTLATLRLLGITTGTAYANRFGGLLFCFLRGRQPEDADAGIYFSRPNWEEVVAWETSMVEDSFGGLT